MIIYPEEKITNISNAQIEEVESAFRMLEKKIAKARAYIKARSIASSNAEKELFNLDLCESLGSITFQAHQAEMAIRPKVYCGAPATEATPDKERNEQWRMTIRNGEVSFARYNKHHQLVGYRPSSLADAFEDAKAILQGFQPLPSRQRLDKLVQQIELG